MILNLVDVQLLRKLVFKRRIETWNSNDENEHYDDTYSIDNEYF